MKATKDTIQEQQNNVVQSKQKESNTGGTATIVDYRSETITQRKLKSSIQSETNSIQLKKPKGSTKFQQIALQMGNTYGVNTSNLSATHNSSFPQKLNAEATIQGNNIHFAPSMDTDYNIRHEVAHAIDNTLNGTPKGDTLVQGFRIDTTREGHVDSMARKAEKSNYFNPVITSEIVKDMNNKSLNPVMQNSLLQRKTILVGETHKKKAITHAGIRVQPSKLVAAIITMNKYKPIKKGKYLKKLETIEKRGELQSLMELGRDIWKGHNVTWGAEDNLIGVMSEAATFYGNASVHPKDERTHIEEPKVREIGQFFIELAFKTEAHFTGGKLRAAAEQDKSGGELILKSVDNIYEHQMIWAPDDTKLNEEWESQQINYTGMFEKIRLENEPNNYKGGPYQYAHDWCIQAETSYRTGLQSLMNAAIEDLELLLDNDDNIDDLKKLFNADRRAMSQEDISRLAHKSSLQSPIKSLPFISIGFGGYARSISQWKSIENQRLNNKHKGYILGEAHLSHIENNLGPKHGKKINKEQYYYVKTDDYKEIIDLEGKNI